MLDKTRKPLCPNWEQKKTVFLRKIPQIFYPFGKCRLVPKNVQGDPLGFIIIHSVAKYQKTRSIKHIFKIPKKSRTVKATPKKIERESFSLVRFYRLR